MYNINLEEVDMNVYLLDIQKARLILYISFGRRMGRNSIFNQNPQVQTDLTKEIICKKKS